MSENPALKPDFHSHISFLTDETFANEIFNPIRPGGGGSEARMTKLTAANQKHLAQ